MNILLSALIASLPLIYWWRFRNTPLDRDYSPYAYPALFKTGYLESGHVDIKPPLIHWSYKAWLGCVSWLNLSLTTKMRLISALSLCATLLLTALGQQPQNALILALLLISPNCWPHMANTEWLSLLIITLAASAAGAVEPLSMAFPLTPMYAELARGAAWFLLGMLPWVNQKNLLLIPVLIFTVCKLPTIGLTDTYKSLFLPLLFPTLLILPYMYLTGRLTKLWYYCFTLPKEFGKKRTLKLNTEFPILRGWIFEAAPFIAIMDLKSPWTIVFAVMVLLMLASKQIVPHHFILLALPVAFGIQTTTLIPALIAYALVGASRSLYAWKLPNSLYALTFGNATTNYGMLLEDADTVEKWIRENTKADEVIWVNGMENQIYINTMRKAWQINIPELTSLPSGEPPRVVVHCPQSGIRSFEYEKYGYAPQVISRLGLYVLMVRK